MGGGYPAFVHGDFFEAGDLEALALFDSLDVVGGFHQAVVGAGVEPGEAAAEEAPECGKVVGGRNNQDIPDSRQHQYADGIIYHRLVVYRKELFTYPL